MEFWRSRTVDSVNHDPEPWELIVPDGQQALLILDGIPMRLYSSGRHRLRSNLGRVEIGLLPAMEDACSRNGTGSHILQKALARPSDRRLLCLDGTMMGIVRDPAMGAVHASTIRAWEGWRREEPSPSAEVRSAWLARADRGPTNRLSSAVVHSLGNGLLDFFRCILRTVKRLDASPRFR